MENLKLYLGALMMRALEEANIDLQKKWPNVEIVLLEKVPLLEPIDADTVLTE
ncbi:hypothetical protein [Ktedonobacter robiniae]|uniref:Uncharacterized protein n=1 Tax=Ktedonobacter robiniae TaxID=2778365 RepID=A0ABQ3US55_9CHLR|nr:hypothetical protein [Ktedonobacter robiniae]GHO55516.1 hypothetical protein KSB_39910 [Ktedonobacter robiniae]